MVTLQRAHNPALGNYPHEKTGVQVYSGSCTRTGHEKSPKCKQIHSVAERSPFIEAMLEGPLENPLRYIRQGFRALVIPITLDFQQ